MALSEDFRALIDTVLSQTSPSFETLLQQLKPMNRPQVEPLADARTQVFDALQEVLEHTDLDEQANFFEAGGSSLKAVLLCARLQELWGTKIPAHLVFLNPILADLANVLSRYAKAVAG